MPHGFLASWAERRLVTAGLLAELVQCVGSGVGESMGLLAQDALASACPIVRGQRVPLVLTVPCSSPGYRAALGSSMELGCTSRGQGGTDLQADNGPRRGCCWHRLSFFNVSPIHCLLVGAFSQGKSLFPSPAGLLELLTGF